jgi:diguanylate cyclase (GGDEF)-like protein/PAS domain S-box-containing protein
MPGAGLLSLLLALILAFAWGLYWHWRLRRELTQIKELAQQLRRLAPGEHLLASSTTQGVTALVAGINYVVKRAGRAEREAAAVAQQLLADLGDRIREAVLVHRDVILYANKQFAMLVGIPRDELRGRRLSELVQSEYAELVSENLSRALEAEAAPERYELELQGVGGPPPRLEVTMAPIIYEHGSALLITGVEVIPTQTVPALLPRNGSHSRHQQALSSLPAAVITTDLAGLISHANPAAEELLGMASEQIVGRTLENVVSLVDETDQRLLLDPVRQSLASGAPVSLARRALLLSRPDGSERAVELSAAPIRLDDTHVAGAAVVLHDVTELRGLARQLSYQAAHDALTGLVNRREMERRLQEALEGGRRGEGPHLFCYLDLDRFKGVNDASGSHLAGDSVLRDVAKLLRAAVRDSDTVARLGGDEFGMLLMGCPLTKGRQIATDLCRDLGRHRFVWRDQIFNIGVSVGLLEISRESGTVEEAIAAADSACFMAKRSGTGQVIVYSARDEALARQSGEIQWLKRLEGALREERFTLYQQPIVPASGEEGEGPAAEVLVRLNDESGNEVAGCELVRAAERYKLMGRIDRWVVSNTLAAVAQGSLVLPPRRSVAINISGQTLSDAPFLDFVVECLDRSGVPAEQVCFELTESAVVAHLEAARRFAGVLHGMGCQFALDDFRAANGSFSSLRSLPLNYAKIDGSLMRNLVHDPVNQTLVGSMIKLARSFSFKVIAEQVEDASVLELARRMGVDYVQGYAIGHPVPLPVPSSRRVPVEPRAGGEDNS